MIEGIMQIGDALDTGEDSLVNFISTVKAERQNKRLNILKLNFDLKNEELLIDALEEMDDDSSEKYNFIGRFGGPNSAQWYVTSNHINYHISETISNLSKVDFGEKNNEDIKSILEKYYFEFDEDFPDKYKYALDIEKFNITGKSMLDILDEAKTKKTLLKDVGKEIISILAREIENFLKNRDGMTLKDFGLFTIAINGENLAQNDSYVREVIKSKENKKDSKSLDIGKCSLCQSMEDLTDKINIDIKLYTTNQIIFSSRLDKKNYYKNMQMCKSCMNKYLIGENYINNNLRTRLGGFDVYIIPQFIYGEPLNKIDLDISVGKIVNSFNTVKSIAGIEDMKYDIENTLEMEDRESYFLLNFLFFKKAQAATKVQSLVKDINPSVLEKIRFSSIKSYEDMVKSLGNNFREMVDLSTVYHMNPIRLSAGNPTEFRSVLQTYESILAGRRLSKNRVIKNINKGIKIIRLKQSGFNIDPSKTSLEFYVLRSNMYIKFLEYLNVIESEGDTMEEKLNIKEDLNHFIESMGYDEEQSSMFLLGSLIGEIGNVQYSKNSEGNKPILNKLNFNGIDKSKLIRLVKDIFNKLNQEKIRSYNELTFFEMKRLLDKNLDSWGLDKDENLFYILSGYSYITTRGILKGRNKDVK